MAHFAEIDESNKVLRTIVVSNNDEADGENFCNRLFGGRWKQTSYNTKAGVHVKGGTPLRKNYAGIGFTYDEARDAFVPPQPYPSWILNEETCTWRPPTPYPEDGADYYWDEDTVSWRIVE